MSYSSAHVLMGRGWVRGILRISKCAPHPPPAVPELKARARGKTAPRLAFRTKVRRPPPKHDPRNRRPANGTWLPLPIIDAMEFLEVAGLAVGIPIIAQRASAVSQRPPQDDFDRPSQRGDLRRVQLDPPESSDEFSRRKGIHPHKYSPAPRSKIDRAAPS